jgi:hypothetical protein
MKKLLLLFLAFLCMNFSYSTEIVQNPYTNLFNAAYQQFPSIPKGVLEAVAFNNTRFTHITHTSTASESCNGVPNAYGVMGLTLNGQDYFYDNLTLITQLTNYTEQDIINNPAINIMAYADAFDSLMVNMSISGNNMKDYIPVFMMLSELPSGTVGQQYAMNAQLYGYFDFLKNADYQQQFNFPNHVIDYTSIFGEVDYLILSSPSVTVTDESVFDRTGNYFTPNLNRSPLSADYGPAIYTAAATCNYSSRSGTAISAVTIHTVQGTYAGCISWFQNCAASVSAHYVLRSSDGQVTQMVLESSKAWHVGSENRIHHWTRARRLYQYCILVYQRHVYIICSCCS